MKDKLAMVVCVVAVLLALLAWSFHSKYPITTGTEIKQYSYDVLGVPCDPPWIYESTIGYTDSMEPDEFGYYGLRGTTVIDGKVKIVGYMTHAECIIIDSYDDQGRPKNGTFAWRLRFDPNNGWIKEETCNWERVNNCPRDENGEYIWIRNDFSENPNYLKYRSLISCDPEDRECWA